MTTSPPIKHPAVGKSIVANGVKTNYHEAGTGHGSDHNGPIVVNVRDDRPFADPAPPAALFHYSPHRKAEYPMRHLKGWRGVLQADAYASFHDLYAPDLCPGTVTEAGARRMRGGNSSTWPSSAVRHWQWRRCAGSTRCSPSSATSPACLQVSA